MVLGIVALCQPWIMLLHSYGVTIILIGLIGFNISSQDRAGAEAGTGQAARIREHSMAEIELRDVEKYLRRRPRHPGSST